MYEGLVTKQHIMNTSKNGFKKFNFKKIRFRILLLFYVVNSIF